MPFIEVDHGASLFYEDWGKGRPVVFVHGWPFSHKIFEHQMIALAEHGHRAIGIDLRGFGHSDKPWEGNDYGTWAHDVSRVMAALDLQDVLLAGYSMGGAVSAHLVGGLKDMRVTRLALLAAAAPSVTPRPEDRETLQGFIEALRADHVKFVHDFMVGACYRPVSQEYVRWLDDIGTAASLHALLRGGEELRDRDLRSEMESIRIPTRIIHGVNDTVVPFALGEEQQQIIKGSELVMFENSGHALFWDEKDRLTEELLNFAQAEFAELAAA